MAELGWTEAQWEKVNRTVTEAFDKVNVAESFLPCFGPLSASAETVKDPQIDLDVSGDKAEFSVDDDGTLKLINLTVRVRLSNEQVSEESLSSAMMTFRRAAEVLAQVEDEIVFNGFDKDVKPQLFGALRPAKAVLSADRFDRLALAHQVVVSGPEGIDGLASTPAARVRKYHPPAAAARAAAAPSPATPLLRASPLRRVTVGRTPRGIVGGVAAAIAALEARGNSGPFACVMGINAYRIVHTPEASMILPSDQIKPMLGGPLLRSGSMVSNHVIVVSLATDVVDIVVATPPRAQFLQLTPDAKYLFRVYEKFILREKDADRSSVFAFRLRAAPAAAAAAPAARAPAPAAAAPAPAAAAPALAPAAPRRRKRRGP